jgi:glycosyltransferase involved in cell wall biosynthesis
MAARQPNIYVLLVGGGPQEAFLQNYAKQLGCEERVIFVGRVPHDTVQKYYDLIDIMVYPRYSKRITELVTPLKPLEAMARGRLLVASDVGGHRELIEHGKTGFLFKKDDSADLAQTILKLLKKQDEWFEIRQNARNYIEQYRNWLNTVRGYQKIYFAFGGKILRTG